RPLESGPQAPNWRVAVKSQMLPQAPQLLGSFISVAGLTSSTIPSQSLSRPSQISTLLLVGVHGPLAASSPRSSPPPPPRSSPPLGPSTAPPSPIAIPSPQLRQKGLDRQPLDSAAPTR